MLDAFLSDLIHVWQNLIRVNDHVNTPQKRNKEEIKVAVFSFETGG